jgi:toxin ParE1/3/4
VAAIVKRPAALLDIEEHVWFNFQDNEEAGRRFPLACDATFERLLESPHIGSARRLLHSRLVGLRRWAVQGVPTHLVFYSSHEDGIEIVSVLHGAREIEDILSVES